MNRTKFSERLKSLCSGMGLSQVEFARQLGLPPTTVSGYVRGEREPSLAMLCRIATFFGTDPNYLLGFEPKKADAGIEAEGAQPIHDRIKSRRQDLGLSVDEVAAALELSRATVYRYESQEIIKIPTAILNPLSRVLRTTPEYLLGRTDEPEVEPMETTAFASRLQILRKNEGLSQAEVAKRLGCCRAAIAMYETGEREPSLSMLCRIADFFHVTTDELLGRDQPDGKREGR